MSITNRTVNPARAGMIRLNAFGTSLTGSKPRASGDDPSLASTA